MRISHKHHLVFLAMPRTGSTTIRRILDDYSDVKSVHVSQVSDSFPFYHHISAAELKVLFDSNGWNWTEYKVFCVVRNPFDRVVSLFHFMKTIGTLKPAGRGLFFYLMRRMKFAVKARRSFRHFVRQLNPTDRLSTSLEAFICDAYGTELVQDLLMFEDLHHQLPRYLRQLDIDIDSDKIPHLNASGQRARYSSYYDEETANRIRELYAYEFDRFDYKFEK